MESPVAHRIACVGYVNARPLIWGLDRASDLSVRLDVPSKLAGMLTRAEADVALLPVIDTQRLGGLTLLSAGGIGCFGPTLTVRIFSKVPPKQIHTLACDPDSHTSVGLARIILAERYDTRPKMGDLRNADCDPGEARLLIGDKVVCDEPGGFEHQLDLGQEWFKLTGLPFVFAVWAARSSHELRDLPARLSTARREGLANVGQIISKYAVPRGWPAGVALQYLTVYLRYTIGREQKRAIEVYHQKAYAHGLLEQPPRPLEWID